MLNDDLMKPHVSFCFFSSKYYNYSVWLFEGADIFKLNVINKRLTSYYYARNNLHLTRCLKTKKYGYLLLIKLVLQKISKWKIPDMNR